MSQLNVDTLGAQTGNDISIAAGKTLKDASGNAFITSSGLVKVASATASSSSELVLDNFVDNSLYSNYKVVFRNINADTNSVNMLEYLEVVVLLVLI